MCGERGAVGGGPNTTKCYEQHQCRFASSIRVPAVLLKMCTFMVKQAGVKVMSPFLKITG